MLPLQFIIKTLFLFLLVLLLQLFFLIFQDEIDMDSVPQEELDSVDDKLGALVGKYLQHKQKSLKNKGLQKLQSDERLLMHFRSRYYFGRFFLTIFLRMRFTVLFCSVYLKAHMIRK